MLDLTNKSVIMLFVDREDKAMLRSNLSARSMPRDGQGHVNSHMLLSSCLSFGLKAINLLAWSVAPSKANLREYGLPVGHMSTSSTRRAFLRQISRGNSMSDGLDFSRSDYS